MPMLTKKEEQKMKDYLREVQVEERRMLLKDKFLLDTTRAGKLLRKGKPFIIVAIDEPYYPEVYRLIRQSETKKGTWTERCEVEFKLFMQRWMQL